MQAKSRSKHVYTKKPCKLAVCFHSCTYEACTDLLHDLHFQERQENKGHVISTIAPASKPKPLWVGNSGHQQSASQHQFGRALQRAADDALLEAGSLPSANCFAECQKSGTRQRQSLSSAALSKELHLVKKCTRQRTSLSSVRLSAKARHSA